MSRQETAPKSRRREWALAALFCLLPAAAVGGGLATAPLLAACGLAAISIKAPARFPWLSALVLVFAGYAALSVFWSPAPRPEQAVKILAVAITGLVLVWSAAELPSQRLVRTCLIGGMIALALLLGAEALFDMPINRAFQPGAETGLLERNPGRGAFLLQAFGLAALGALAGMTSIWRWALGIGLLAAMAALSLQFGMAANSLVLIAGFFALLLGWRAPRLAPLLVGTGLAIWMLAAPWVMLTLRGAAIAPSDLPESWAMRLQIWDYAAHRISERPLFGWGLDSSRVFDDPLVLGDITYAAIPLHPHSVSLQVWLETGVIGAILAAAMLVLSGVYASRQFASQPSAAGAIAAGMAAIGLAWNLSYGAWQEWFMALPFIMAAAAFAAQRQASPTAAQT